MRYAMINRPTDWMPLERHKRSQNAGLVYTLVDALMRDLLYFDSAAE
jgi:hypothetical protein